MLEMRGMPVVNALLEKYKVEVDNLKANGVEPKLAVVRVGSREDDLAYERGILKRFAQAEALVEVFELPEDVSQEDLEAKIVGLNEDEKIHGILLFRPLPKHLDENKVKNLVCARKDVDCMSDENFAHAFAQDGKGYPPCTPEAVIEILKHYEIPMKGKKAVVVGRSMVVGKPLAMLLLKENATVTICHTKTENLEKECQEADILCAAAGCAKMLGDKHVKMGQVVMDVGINMVEGALCGDVDYAAVAEKTQGITPVPGGVGTVTTTMLLKHVLISAGAKL